MTLESLIVYTPFLGLLYLAYALLQILRRRQQGFGAVLLALLALVVPVAALLLTQNAVLRAQLVNRLTLNAAIVFAASLVLRAVEQRRSTQTASRSYGMLGVGLGVLLAAGVFVAPLIPAVSASSGTVNTASAQPGAMTQMVSNVAASAAAPTAFATVLTEQTGLTSEDVTAALEAGSTIAELVAANNGELEAVVTAAVSGLDDLQTAGGMPAQMLANLGTDTAAIAAHFVNGELDSRAQQFLARLLISGESGFPGGQPPVGGLPAAGEATLSAPAGFAPPANSEGQPVNPVAVEPTAQPTSVSVTPTTVTVRPTLMVFPTAMPTVPPAVATVTSTTAAEAGVTCTLTINYNLNLREAPTTDSAVLLSIAYGSSVSASGRSTDGWYQVTYSGTSGWVSGDYVVPAAACAALPATAN